MRIAFRVAGSIALGLVFLIGVIAIWATLDTRLNGLSRDSLPIVETGGYRFEAPANWITDCDEKAPGCLAVVTRSPDPPLWTQRTYWIEVQPVDATGPQPLAQTALDAVRAIVEADSGDPSQIVQVDSQPLEIEGVRMIDFVDSSAKRFSRSRVVQLPAGDVLRFTCYGEEKREFAEHDGACFDTLSRLHFPEAEKLALQRRYDEEQALERRYYEEKALQRELEESQALAAQASIELAMDMEATRQGAARQRSAGRGGGAEPSPNAPLFGPDLVDEVVKNEEKREDERAARRSQPGASARFTAAVREAIAKSREAIRSGGPVSGFDGAYRPDISAARKAIATAMNLSVDAADEYILHILAARLSMPEECAQEDLVGAFDILTPVKPDCEPEALKRTALDGIAEIEESLSATRP